MEGGGWRVEGERAEAALKTDHLFAEQVRISRGKGVIYRLAHVHVHVQYIYIMQCTCIYSVQAHVHVHVQCMYAMYSIHVHVYIHTGTHRGSASFWLYLQLLHDLVQKVSGLLLVGNSSSHCLSKHLDTHKHNKQCMYTSD